MKSHRIKSFVLSNGERYCTLDDRRTGIPADYPLLFVTTSVRNASKSYASMEAAYSSIGVLIYWCEARSVDLVARFLSRAFLEGFECNDIRDHCQKDFGRDGQTGFEGTVIPIKVGKKGYTPPANYVRKGTQYARLTQIAAYVDWLAKHLLSKSLDRETTFAIERMKVNLLKLRPIDKGRNEDYGHDPAEEKELNEEQEALLISILEPDSPRNPFESVDVRLRNQLMIDTERLTGIRGGELLNLRVGDIRWQTNSLVIHRRADDKADTRKRQPLVKTRSRLIPLAPSLVEGLQHYVQKVRRRIPGATRHPYLFVVHKPGPTQGQPLSISSYRQVIEQIRGVDPLLAVFHPHGLRHDWNEGFSESMDKKENLETQAEQEKIRSYLMGWNEGSGTARVYNKRFTKRKANKAGLEMQQELLDRAEALRRQRQDGEGKKRE